LISRYEFIKDSISSDNPTHDLSHYYDEMSVLYYLIGGRSDIDIFTGKDKGKFGFSLLLEKEESASILQTRCNGAKYNVYGESYKIKAKISKPNTVFLTIKKEKEV